jgi:hypothetical protein
MTQEEDQRRILARRQLMYVRNPYTTGNFLTSCATPSFSVTILFCRVITICKLFVKHRMKMGMYYWLVSSTTSTFVSVFAVGSLD